MNIAELNNLGLSNKNKKIDNRTFDKSKTNDSKESVNKIEINDNIFISKTSYNKFQKSVEVKELLKDIENLSDNDSEKDLEEIKKKVKSGFYDNEKVYNSIAKKIIKGILE